MRETGQRDHVEMEHGGDAFPVRILKSAVHPKAGIIDKDFDFEALTVNLGLKLIGRERKA